MKKMGKIIQNYSIQQLLGQGVYGKVYKAVHMKTKQQVAIKVIHADKFKQIPKLEECTVNEINILSTMQSCPYIVKYIDMLKTVNNFYFVYEFCNGGTLDKMMQKQGPFPQKRALIYFRQMVQAFKILSKNNIMHRDLKPDNILMHNGAIKLGDFGFCKPLESPLEMAHTMLGSPIYMAPEVLKGETYNMKADIWSLGVVLFQMVFGKCPFESKSIAKLIKLLEVEDLKFPDAPDTPKISPTLEKLLRRMLVKDYLARIQWSQIFEFIISESGEIMCPKSQTPLNQFQLRGSIKSSTNFGMFNPSSSSLSNQSQTPSSSLNSSQSVYTNSHSTNPTSTQPYSVTSPKINKSYDMSYEQAKNLMMKKKSPIKEEGQYRNSTQYSRGDIYNKTERQAARLEMLSKNHGKLLAINQIALDAARSAVNKDKTPGIAAAYILFRNIEKQFTIVADTLRKQSYDQRSQQFRSIIDKQLQQLRQIMLFFKQTLQDQQSFSLVQDFQQPNKSRIMKQFYDQLSIQVEEEVILAAQVIDYLDEGLLIKKDSYERMGRDMLLKQVKNKFSKYF